MKKLLILIAIVAIVATLIHSIIEANTRDYAYEAYCDSVYKADPEYYYGVLVKTDEFQYYIEDHGKWW